MAEEEAKNTTPAGQVDGQEKKSRRSSLSRMLNRYTSKDGQGEGQTESSNDAQHASTTTNGNRGSLADGLTIGNSTTQNNSHSGQKEEKPASKEDLFPGDDIISDAMMVYDQKRTIRANADEIFPWLKQMGKGRGGFYLPLRMEAVLPKSRRASRQIEPEWQRLTPGERLSDYGFDAKEDYFVVERVEEPHTIVLRSRRYGCDFTWALLLRQLHEDSADPEPATVVHLRFRGKIEAEGAKRKMIIQSGRVLEKIGSMPLLAGLAERCEKPKPTKFKEKRHSESSSSD
jgi:hypothetical protein